MSNRLAIAATTATLQDRLLGAATAEIPGTNVVASRPDSRRAADNGPGINVFLYEVVANPFLRNGELPTRNAAGALVNAPLAALDLHYLISFHGKDSGLEAQRLLGAVIANLATVPVLTADEIARSVAARPYLAGADLAQQMERVYLTPLHLSLEEVSRLWSVMIQEPYSLSMQYVASVVLVSPEVIATPNPRPQHRIAKVDGSIDSPQAAP